MDVMASAGICVECGTAVPARPGGGHVSMTCSPECKERRTKAIRKKRYAENREQAIIQAREWALANREHVTEQRRRYREANKEVIAARKRSYAQANAEREAERKAAWYVANRDRIRAEWQARQDAEARVRAAERTRAWAQMNPEHRRHLRRKWRRENPEKAAAIVQRRRARLQGVPAETVYLSELLEAQRFRCALCRKKIDPKVRFPDPMSASTDHVIPLSQGGTGERANLRAAHMGCNSAKRDGVWPGGEQLAIM